MSPIAPALDQLNAEVARLTAALGRRVDVAALGITDRADQLSLDPPGGQISCNRACRLVETADGWIALNLARDEDRDLIPAWLESEVGDEPWEAITGAARTRPCAELLAGADLLGLPAGRVGELICDTLEAPRLTMAAGRIGRSGPPRMVDLSALWAGPMCGAILAEAGAAVTKIESTRRPDSTRTSTPEFFNRLNGRKQHLSLDLTSPAGQARLRDAVLATDVLITSVRPRALASLGLGQDTIFAANPGLVWVAITGYGWTGAAASRVAFGDDAAAAGGLVGWTDGAPHFLGDALADPVTGLAAAISALKGLEAGGGVLVDVPLARTAAAASRRLWSDEHHVSLALRNVELGGRTGLDVLIADGRIASVGPKLGPAQEEIDGHGGALIPGLADHHIHLFALAAEAGSVSLAGAASAKDVRSRIEAALVTRPPGAWLRVTGYHETVAGDLTRAELDALAPRHRLRVQHQTGALWVLNSAALDAVRAETGPSVIERDATGRPTGRIWRGDAWLRAQIGDEPPDLARIGRRLAGYGITHLTDASVTTDAGAAARLADAHRAGNLPQHLTLMSGGALGAPADGAFAVGPVKVLLDDHDLPPLDDFIAWIGRARSWGRPVAVHCVTAAELAVALAAFEAAGAKPGDRIEHGGVIPAEAIATLRAMGLTVVTQSAFIRERGDRYAAEVEPRDQADLYRCASLLAAGVPVAGSSDAPYASPDPWLGMATAADRQTAAGRTIGAGERVIPETALAMYLGPPEAPARPARRVEVGAPADLCLLGAPLRDVLAAPSAELVRVTLISGRPVFPSPLVGEGASEADG